MAIRLRWLAIAFLVLRASTGLAAADTAAGVAAYDNKDYTNALKLLKPEAENGDPEAQVKYGLIFAKGLGVTKDAAEAFNWFQKSAAQGNVEAMFCMGIAFDIGDADGGKDPAKAAAWYRKAAEKGYARAEYNLAGMLQYGDGVPANLGEGAAWLRKAAEQSYPPAERGLAYDSIKGEVGVEQNLLAARYWAQRSKQHGDADGTKIAEILEKEFARMEQEDHVPRVTGGDGSSIERAIQLPDEKTEMTGVDAEYKVLGYYFPGYGKKSQALMTGPDQRPYDLLTIQKNGKSRDVYFDISNFFGNME
jgi:hypothetical protein